MDYEDMLKRARENLPESVLKISTERFEIPKVMGHIQGNKTIISNIYKIADALGRDVVHLSRYLLRELATPGDLKSAALILGTKVPASRVNEKIQQYADEYVICPECGKPDTKLTKEDKTVFMKCTVCGARHTIASRTK